MNLNSDEILDERNKRIAEAIGKKLGYSAEKVRDVYCTLGVLTKDSTPSKMLEYLYEKLWHAQPNIKRKDVQQVIKRCHEDAIGWLQNTHNSMHGN